MEVKVCNFCKTLIILTPFCNKRSLTYLKRLRSYRMFEEMQVEDSFSLKRWSMSFLVSGMFYVALCSIILSLKTGVTYNPFDEPKVEVKFVEKILKEAKKPEPVVKNTPPPPIPKHLKVKKVAKPISKKLVAPTEVPKAPPKEADPSQDKGVAVYGDYDPNRADPLGLEGGIAAFLPEDAAPPRPFPDNPKPPYPTEARKRGVTGVVILKVIIDSTGRIAKVDILKGKEPFVSAAVQAVKKWRYTPAYYEGEPISIYRVIKIPFKLIG